MSIFLLSEDRENSIGRERKLSFDFCALRRLQMYVPVHGTSELQICGKCQALTCVLGQYDPEVPHERKTILTVGNNVK